jgi:hypothetical protein
LIFASAKKKKKKRKGKEEAILMFLRKDHIKEKVR